MSKHEDVPDIRDELGEADGDDEETGTMCDACGLPYEECLCDIEDDDDDEDEDEDDECPSCAMPFDECTCDDDEDDEDDEDDDLDEMDDDTLYS